MPAPRLQASLLERNPTIGSDDPTEDEVQRLHERLDNLVHYSVPTLAHLLALVLHSPPKFASAGTELLVIDSLATLIDSAHTRMNDRPNVRKNDSKSASDRRRNVIADIARSLTRLAAVKNIAVIVTNHVVTQIRSQPMSALLKPALTTMEWENAMSTRVVLFRDWADCQTTDEQSGKKRVQAARFAKVIKAGGVKLPTNRTDTLCAFEITDTGLQELTDTSIAEVATDAASGAPMIPSKRGIDDVEAGGSDDEYGWTEDDIQIATEGLVDERFLTARDVKAAEQAEQASKKAEEHPARHSDAEEDG